MSQEGEGQIEASGDEILYSESDLADFLAAEVDKIKQKIVEDTIARTRENLQKAYIDEIKKKGVHIWRIGS